MSTKMDDSKIEVNLTICRGCLSSDRILLPLKQNFDLYTLLLNDGMIYKQLQDLKYFNTYFCWECTALLRRMKEFQKRIQKAQYYFDQLLSENEILFKKECLSTLKVVKNGYIEHSDHTELLTDLKTEDLLKCNNPDIQDNECTIKEENFDDIDNDNDIPSLNEDDFYEIPHDKKESTKVCRVKTKVESNLTNKDEGSKRISRMTKVNFKLDSSVDNEKVETCTFSFKELESMRKRKNSTWKIRGFNNRANTYIKYLMSLRKEDELQSRQKADTNITCSSCKSSVPTMEISQHWDAHIITLYKCKYCQYYGKTVGDLSYHVKQHTVMYRCNECGLQYGILKEFFSHYKNMHERSQCDYCGIKFQYKKSVERHIKNHHLPSRCDQCNRTYTNYRLLRRHMQAVHPTVKREMCYCVECDAYFKNSIQYKHHLKTTRMHRIKPLEKIPCPDCGKEFTRKSYMNKHYQLVHQNQSKHYCEICDKHFFNGYGLRTHRKFIHLKTEKPRDKLCTYCGRGFFTNRILIQHMRTHTGERPYKCSVCNAAFAQKYAMQNHEKNQHKIF